MGTWGHPNAEMGTCGRGDMLVRLGPGGHRLPGSAGRDVFWDPPGQQVVTDSPAVLVVTCSGIPLVSRWSPTPRQCWSWRVLGSPWSPGGHRLPGSAGRDVFWDPPGQQVVTDSPAVLVVTCSGIPLVSRWRWEETHTKPGRWLSLGRRSLWPTFLPLTLQCFMQTDIPYPNHTQKVMYLF